MQNLQSRRGRAARCCFLGGKDGMKPQGNKRNYYLGKLLIEYCTLTIGVEQPICDGTDRRTGHAGLVCRAM